VQMGLWKLELRRYYVFNFDMLTTRYRPDIEISKRYRYIDSVLDLNRQLGIGSLTILNKRLQSTNH
jgi:hypothetical protein